MSRAIKARAVTSSAIALLCEREYPFVLKENAMAKHPETNCDCGAKAASPLALRWRCSVCGTSAIMKISTLATVCDGERIRKAEPQADRE